MEAEGDVALKRQGMEVLESRVKVRGKDRRVPRERRTGGGDARRFGSEKRAQRSRSRVDVPTWPERRNWGGTDEIADLRGWY